MQYDNKYDHYCKWLMALYSQKKAIFEMSRGSDSKGFSDIFDEDTDSHKTNTL